MCLKTLSFGMCQTLGQSLSMHFLSCAHALKWPRPQMLILGQARKDSHLVLYLNESVVFELIKGNYKKILFTKVKTKFTWNLQVNLWPSSVCP